MEALGKRRDRRAARPPATLDRLIALAAGAKPYISRWGWQGVLSGVLILVGVLLLAHVEWVRHEAAVAQAQMKARFEKKLAAERAAAARKSQGTAKPAATSNAPVSLPAPLDYNEMEATTIPGYLFLKGVSNMVGPRAGAEVAELTIPKIGLDDIMTEGDTALSSGPIHVAHTALPGETGNMVIAAHNALYFQNIGKLQPGDKIYLTTQSGSKYLYVVVKDEIVPAQASIPVYPYPASLTLESCYPLNGMTANSTSRFLVQARLAMKQ